MVKKSKTKRNFRLSMDELDVLGELEVVEEYVESWEEAFELFHKAGILKGLREATLFHYESQLKSLLRALPVGIKPYEVTKEHIEDAIVFCKVKRNLQPSTINIVIRANKTFLKFLFENKHIPINPIKDIKKLKTRTKEVEVLTPKQLKTLLSKVDRKTWNGIRDYAILLVLIETGLRQNEILNLCVLDVVWEQDLLLVKHTKTFHQRKVPVTDSTKNALKRWLLIRGEVHTKRLFCGISGMALTSSGLRQMIYKYAKLANIQSRCSPHIFRHTFASIYLRNGGDLFSLQQIMGHSDITMTRRYTHFMFDDITELHKKYSPLRKLAD